VTLRKFISLIFSIFYFKNPFSFYHWVGTCLVFGGTIIFLDLVTMIR
jgi:UDP-xylose/UDP-N-acetylglucosamine transporter B4